MKANKFELIYHIMLLPGMILLLIFSIIPMFGIVIAFEKFIPAKGIFRSAWVGLDNFIYMFQIPDVKQIFMNTVVIAVGKIIANLIVPLIFAILLNEIRTIWFKRTLQTIVYLPHFLSWVILANIFVSNFFSLDGIVNQILEILGIQPVFFLASNAWFQPIIIGTDVWKEFGFGAVIYLAAMTGINPELYESAVIDGASRMQKIKYITIPGITPTIILLGTLALGNVLNANFDQIFNFYNPLVYQTGDIIDTYVYRMGLGTQNGLGAPQYGFATAVGLIKSIVSFGLIVTSYKLANRFANYRIF
jgi:putative aldouronate transport system permease protein